MPAAAGGKHAAVAVPAGAIRKAYAAAAERFPMPGRKNAAAGGFFDTKRGRGRSYRFRCGRGLTKIPPRYTPITICTAVGYFFRIANAMGFATQNRSPCMVRSVLTSPSLWNASRAAASGQEQLSGVSGDA